MTEDAKKLAVPAQSQPAQAQSAKPQPAKPQPGKTGGAKGKKVKQEESILDIIKTVVSVVAIVLVVRTFVFEPFNIPSGSMKPTLLVGDFVFVSKFSYGYSKYSFPWIRPPIGGRVFGSLPKRGDVVVFKLPRDTSVDYIKRIVGLPGDKIQMIDGVLNINSQPVKLQRIEDGFDTDPNIGDVQQFIETLPNGVQHPIFKHVGHQPYDDTAVFTVPEGNVFAMGDNRDNSLDSRVPPQQDGVGYIPVENLVGRAEIRWFSFENKDPWWYGPFGIRYSRLFTGVH
ncbi:MAG: signal peptidase I [Aliidongia sp.]